MKNNDHIVLLCWETFDPGNNFNVALTCITHFNTIVDQVAG